MTPEIDLTNLIDVLFILILFFVLTTSFVQGQIATRLPEGKGNPIKNTPVVIAVKADGSLLVGGAPMTKETLLVEALRFKRQGRDLLIAGDKDVAYGKVASLLDELRSEGIEEVGLAFSGEKTP